MWSRLRFVFAVGALGGAVSCASIVGLDMADPDVSNVSPLTDGGTTDPGATVSGDGSIQTVEGITISPAQVGFQFDCNTTSSAEVTIKNDGSGAQPFKVSLPTNSNFTIKDAIDGALSGTIAAHGKQIVVIEAAGALPGGVSADMSLTAGATVTSIAIQGDIRGAGLTVSPLAVDFGLIRANVTSAPITATFTNTGNEPVVITAFPGGGADFVTPNGLMIPAGGVTTGDFILNAGLKGPKLAVGVTPTITTKLCTPAPLITLTGQRANDDVTVGPTTLDFGAMYCLSNPTKQLTVTVANYGDAIHYTSSITGSGFKIVSGGSGDVLQGDGVETATNATITVAVNPPGNFYGPLDEMLTVTPADKAPIVIALKAVVNGADMKYDNNSVSLSAGGRNAVTLRNVGNATVCVNYDFSPKGSCGWDGCSTPAISSENDGDVFGARSVGDVGVYLNQSSQDHNTYTAKVTISHESCSGGTVSAPFCNPPPPVLNVTGRR